MNFWRKLFGMKPVDREPDEPRWYALPHNGAKVGPMTMRELRKFIRTAGTSRFKLRLEGESKWVARDNTHVVYPELVQAGLIGPPTAKKQGKRRGREAKSRPSTMPRIFDPRLPADKLMIAIVKQLVDGTDPRIVREALVRDLGRSLQDASDLVIAAHQGIQYGMPPGHEQELDASSDDPASGTSPSALAQRMVDRPPAPRRMTPVKTYSEEDLVRLGSFEVRMPSGDGRCSDNDCPCPPPGTPIPHGRGYLFIDSAVVDFREDARTDEGLKRKAASIQRDFERKGATILHDPVVYKAILMCEQGARRRHLDLKTAAEDAQLAWAEGRAPLRATPKTP